jgi:ankyrin repeat protein
MLYVIILFRVNTIVQRLAGLFYRFVSFFYKHTPYHLQQDGKTALLISSEVGTVDVLALLLDGGANVHATNSVSL